MAPPPGLQQERNAVFAGQKDRGEVGVQGGVPGGVSGVSTGPVSSATTMPALLKSISMPPRALAPAAKTDSQMAGSVRSPMQLTALPPAAVIACAVSSAGWARMSQTMTPAPSAANFSAVGAADTAAGAADESAFAAQTHARISASWLRRLPLRGEKEPSNAAEPIVKASQPASRRAVIRAALSTAPAQIKVPAGPKARARGLHKVDGLRLGRSIGQQIDAGAARGPKGLHIGLDICRRAAEPGGMALRGGPGMGSRQSRCLPVFPALPSRVCRRAAGRHRFRLRCGRNSGLPHGMWRRPPCSSWRRSP